MIITGLTNSCHISSILLLNSNTQLIVYLLRNFEINEMAQYHGLKIMSSTGQLNRQPHS